MNLNGICNFDVKLNDNGCNRFTQLAPSMFFPRLLRIEVLHYPFGVYQIGEV